ncbi:MAG TPA: acyltransferase [Stellaceae bacterium]|jgi:peptidoglycan/LPS O-acetylase OafA/YrhL|nr:acyltransferase [Stellaceae bacterium]
MPVGDACNRFLTNRANTSSLYASGWGQLGIMHSTISNRRITALDGWRGISILCVLLSHLVNFRYGALLHSNPPNIAFVLATWGVDVFFVISGFIITRLAIFEYNANAGFSIRNFYIRRLFRIAPPLYLYIVFLGIVSAASLIQQDQSGILAAAAFTCNFSTSKCGWFLGHTWTLAYEEQFYLAFPFIFYWCGKRFNLIIVLLFVILLVFPFFRYLLNLSSAWHTVSSFSFPFSFICIGSVIAAHEERFKNLVLARFSVYISYGIFVMLFVLLVVDVNFSFAPKSAPSYIRVMASNILPICFAWMIGSAAFKQTRWTWFLNTPFLQFFGMISYSLYIWQMVFTAAPNLYPKKSWLLFAPFMILVASFSYYAVEQPSIRLGKNLVIALRARHGALAQTAEKNV